MKAIIDCDPGVDDALAILLALTDASSDILAYVPQFGNTSLENAYNNILKIYGVLDRHVQEHDPEMERFLALRQDRKPRLIRGAAGPIAGPAHSAAYFHGKDGLGDITEKHKDIPLPSLEDVSHLLDIADTSKSGVQHTLELLKAQDDHSVSYIALGPLTNLALALQADEKLVKQKIGLVSIMGGNLDVPGNTSPVAEFNVWADAHAAHIVFQHADTLPIYLLPLDITTDHSLPWASYHSRVDDTLHHHHSSLPKEASEKAHLPKFTTSFLRHTREIMESFGKDGMELHDPTAVWFAMENKPGRPLSDGWKSEKREFVVEREGEYTRGMCVVDRRNNKKAGHGTKFGKSMAELREEEEEKKKTNQQNQSSSPSSATAAIAANGQEQPAPVQVDEPAQADIEQDKGVNVVVRTPGSEALVERMLRDIWGA